MDFLAENSDKICWDESPSIYCEDEDISFSLENNNFVLSEGLKVNRTDLNIEIPSTFPSELSEIALKSGISELPNVQESPIDMEELNNMHEVYSQFYINNSYIDEMENLAKEIRNNKFQTDNVNQNEDKILQVASPKIKKSNEENEDVTVWPSQNSQTTTKSKVKDISTNKNKNTKRKVYNDDVSEDEDGVLQSLPDIRKSNRNQRTNNYNEKSQNSQTSTKSKGKNNSINKNKSTKRKVCNDDVSEDEDGVLQLSPDIKKSNRNQRTNNYNVKSQNSQTSTKSKGKHNKNTKRKPSLKRKICNDMSEDEDGALQSSQDIKESNQNIISLLSQNSQTSTKENSIKNNKKNERKRNTKRKTHNDKLEFNDMSDFSENEDKTPRKKSNQSEETDEENNNVNEEDVLSENNNYSQISVGRSQYSQTSVVSRGNDKTTTRRRTYKKRKTCNDKPEFTGPSFFSENQNVIMQTRTRTIKKSNRYQHASETVKETKSKKNIKKNVSDLNEELPISLKTSKPPETLHTSSSDIQFVEEEASNPILISLTDDSTTNMDNFDKMKLSIPCSEPADQTGCIHFLSTSSENEMANSNSEANQENMETDVAVAPQETIICDSCRAAWDSYRNNLSEEIKRLITLGFNLCDSLARFLWCNHMENFIADLKSKCK